MKNVLKTVTVILMAVLLAFSSVLLVFSQTVYGRKAPEITVETTSDTTDEITTEITTEPILEEPVCPPFEIVDIRGGDPLCDHTWPSWIDMVPPSVGKVGTGISYCPLCGAVQKKVLEALPDPDERFVIDGVENILQNPDLPNGCEIVSLSIVLNYMGVETDPVKLSDEYLPKGLFWYDSPYEKYIGDPKGNGTGCYAKCIADTANRYLKDKGSDLVCYNISGKSFDELEEYVDDGVPVIVWGTVFMDCDPTVCYSYWYGDDVVTWYSHSHCLVMIGHSAYTYVFADPLCGITNYSREDVEKSYEQEFMQACIIIDPETKN